MPQTKFQKYFFMSLTVLLSVTAFTTYNVAIFKGGMSGEAFLLALREIPVEFLLAFLLEATVVYRAAEKIAFSLVDPRKDAPVFVMLAITCASVWIMCPAMSFLATVLYNGLNGEFLSNWLQKVVFNFPFAFFIQIFLVGPVVRLVFRTVFRDRTELAAR